MFLTGLGLLIFALSMAVTYMGFSFMIGSFSRETAMILLPVIVVCTVSGIILMVVGLCMKRKVNRTTVRVKSTNSEEMQRKVSALLERNGYKSITQRGEKVWKCGVGFLTAIKYIKIEFVEYDTMLVSGWVRTVGGNEQDLSGKFVCILPKKQVRKVITEIQSFAN